MKNTNLQCVTSQKHHIKQVQVRSKVKQNIYLVGLAALMWDSSQLLQLVHGKHYLILPMPVIKQTTINATREVVKSV